MSMGLTLRMDPAVRRPGTPLLLVWMGSEGLQPRALS